MSGRERPGLGPVLRWALCILTAMSLWACAGPGPTYRNSDGQVIDKPWSEVMAWMLNAWQQGLPPPPGRYLAGGRFPVVREPDVDQALPTDQLAITWLGHASTLIRMGGQRILTDPHFSQRASPVGWAGTARTVPAPYRPDELGHIDLVLISHNHFDHLDEASVLALARQPGGSPLFLVPQGLDGWFKERGMDRVKPLAWWQAGTFGPLQVHAVPAHHWSARGLTDRHQSHWAGWVLKGVGRSVYFAGDTGYSDDFKVIRERLGPVDLALLPVGAYEPRAFMKDQHVNPEEAVKIHRDVGARLSIGIHWGTFALSDEPLDAPLAELPAARARAGLPADAFRLLQHGQTLHVPLL